MSSQYSRTRAGNSLFPQGSTIEEALLPARQRIGSNHLFQRAIRLIKDLLQSHTHTHTYTLPVLLEVYQVSVYLFLTTSRSFQVPPVCVYDRGVYCFATIVGVGVDSIRSFFPFLLFEKNKEPFLFGYSFMYEIDCLF